MSIEDTYVCVACGRKTTDRYFTNAASTALGDDARSLPLPVPLCRTCKPVRPGDTAPVANNAPVDVVVGVHNGNGKPTG